MPRRVDELDLRNGGSSIKQSDLLLVVAPDTNEIYKTPAADFRGSSVFVSTSVPTDTPEDPSIPRYIEGDVYYYISAKGIEILSWNVTDLRWDKQGFANGARFWDRDSLENSSLDSATTNPYINNKVKEGDFYFNKSRGAIFGPYSVTTGWDFSQSTYSGWSYIRGNITITVVGNDTKGYENPADYLDPSPNPLMKDYAPKTGDIYWLQKPNGNGHGGFIWRFDENRFNNTTGTRKEKLAAGWGAREYYRQPSVISASTAPVQDNNAYRQDDSVIDSSNAVLYATYDESAPANTTDLGILFAEQISLKGSSIKSLDVVPTSNDAAYVGGDYVITTEGKTTRLHGPYVFNAATDVEAWPLSSVLRRNIVHNAAPTELPPTTFVGDYPYHTDGTMIVNGDLWRRDYGADKSILYTDGVIIDYTAKTMDWGTGLANERPVKFWTQVSPAWPVTDDNNYFEGDFIITGDNRIYGPYKMGKPTSLESWPFFSKIDGYNEWLAKDRLPTYVPSKQIDSIDWGGGKVSVNEVLTVTYAGSTTGKSRKYLATVIDSVTNLITWELIPEPITEHVTGTNGWPAKNDANYKTGDYIVSKDGFRYGPYVEGAANDVLAWPFNQVRRSAKTVLYDNVTWPLTLPTTNLLADGSFLTQGDTLRFQNANKCWEYTVITANNSVPASAITLSSHVNLKGTITHNTTVSARPARDDNRYSVGDYNVNGFLAMYGPYVEGQVSDDLAWPVKGSLQGTNLYTDITTGLRYKLVVDNGIPYLEETS